MTPNAAVLMKIVYFPVALCLALRNYHV